MRAVVFSYGVGRSEADAQTLPDESWPTGVCGHCRSCYECDWTLRNDLRLIVTAKPVFPLLR